MTNLPAAGRIADRARTARFLDQNRKALRSPLLVLGCAILLLFALVAIFAPLIAPYDPRAISGPSLAHPSAGHLLGTGAAGQDTFSQVIWGSRSSLIVAVAAATLATALGILVGMGSALVGGALDTLAMRAVDMFMALPALVLAILITTLVGSSRTIIVLVIANAGWPPVARTLRSQTLTIRRRGFVGASRGFGAGALYLIRRHLIPAVGPLIVARWVAWAGVAVFLEAGLAFLGLGDPLHPSWGTILDGALGHPGLFYGDAWLWWVLPAALAVSVMVMGFSLLAVGLEPFFNRRLDHG